MAEHNYHWLSERLQGPEIPKESCSTIDSVFHEFRSVDCAECGRHIALQLRSHPEVNMCSTRCLSVRIQSDGNLGMSRSMLEDQRCDESDEGNEQSDIFSTGHMDVDAKTAAEFYGQLQSTTLQFWSELSRDENPRWYLQDLERSRSFRDGGSVEVMFVWNPSRLSLMSVSDFNLSAKMAKEIDEYCVKAPPMQRFPREDEIVLAPYSDSLYYRGVVKEVNMISGEVLVTFVDYGDDVTVEITDCKDITENLATYPILSAQFVDVGVHVDNDQPPSVSVLNALRKAGDLYDFIMHIDAEDSHGYRGALLIEQTNMTWASLVQDLCATAEDTEWESTSNSNSNKILTFPWQQFHHSTKLSENFKDGAQVIVTYQWGYTKLTLTTEADQNELDQLVQAIARHVNAVKHTLRTPEVGEIILARYEDRLAYRAVVTAVQEQSVHVRFLDFGDEATVTAADLWELSEEINQHPIYGLTWTIPNIPEAANQLYIPELDAFYENGRTARIQVAREENCQSDSWSGVLWLEENLSWNQILRDELIASGYKFMEVKKTFNPWSQEVLKHFRDRCCDPARRTVDAWLTSIYGANYLLKLSQRTFPTFWSETKGLQLSALRKESTTFSKQEWSDRFEDFYYSEASIPIARAPAGTEVNVKITNFMDLHCWSGYIDDEPWNSYRRRLRTMMDDFCSTRRPPDKFYPQKGQICLVKVPTWKQIDETMERVKHEVRGKWRPNKWRRTDQAVEDTVQAGHWYRGVVISRLEDWDFGREWTECYSFWLPDVSRTVPVHKDFILPAPFRFVAVPNLGIAGTLLLQHFDRLTATERKDKWYYLFPRGSIIPCTVMDHDGDLTIFKMPSEIEAQLNQKYSDRPKRVKRRRMHSKTYRGS